MNVREDSVSELVHVLWKAPEIFNQETKKPTSSAGLSSSVGYLLILFDYFSIISFPADAQAWQTCTAIGEGSEAPKAAPGDTEVTLK